MLFIHILDSSAKSLRNQQSITFQILRIGREVIFPTPASCSDDDPDIRTPGTDRQDFIYCDCPVLDDDLVLQTLLYITQRNGPYGMSDGYAPGNAAAKRTDDSVIKSKLILQGNRLHAHGLDQLTVILILSAGKRILDKLLHRILRKHRTVQGMYIRRIADAVGRKSD